MVYDPRRLLLEHASIFQGFLAPKQSLEGFKSAKRYQNQVFIDLMKMKHDPTLSQRVFLSLGGTVSQEPINKQDPTSPLVARWTWGNGVLVTHSDFVNDPRALVNWLEFFPTLRWRLERLPNGYGTKIYRTVYCHERPTVALALACINYAQVLLGVLKDDQFQGDDLEKIETTQGIEG